MKVPSRLILRMFLAYGLMNREMFEEHISRLISKYTSENENPEKFYDFLFSQMEELKNYLTLEHIVNQSLNDNNDELRSEINELRKAIDELNKKLDKPDS